MNRTSKNPAGVSNPNPRKTVTPTASKEVQPPAAAVTPPVAGGSPVVGTGPTDGTAHLSAVIDTFETASEPAFDVLSAGLGAVTPSEEAHFARVGGTRRAAIGLLIKVLAANPGFAADFTADDLSADLGDVEACEALGVHFKAASTQVDTARRAKLEVLWTRSSEVYAVARKRAKNDKVLAQSVASIRSTLANGPRSQTAAHTALDAEQKATVATERATKATAKATSAAAKVPARTNPGAVAEAGSTPAASPAVTIK